MPFSLDQLSNDQFQKNDMINKVTANPSLEADAEENIQIQGINTLQVSGQEGIQLSNDLGQKPHL